MKKQIENLSANNVRVPLLITYKNVLENMQRENKNLQTSNGLDKSKYTQKNTHVYLLFGAMGHHAPAGRSISLSLLAMEDLWLNARMNE